jgi:hypothetical protein
MEPEKLSAEQRDVLARLSRRLWDFGTANDAQDHGAAAEAARLRLEAAAEIGELLREHPFLEAWFPSLGRELASRHIETTGWSTLADAVDGRLRRVRVEAIPWDRVVHLRGRATDMPAWIAQLTTDAHVAAERRLADCLIGQNRVTQATPLAARLILGALRFGMVRDEGAVWRLVEAMVSAARSCLKAASPAAFGTAQADWSWFSNDRLWPAFESAPQDEAIGREWKPSDEEVLGWALLTVQVLEEHRRLMARRPPRKATLD